MFFPNTSFTAKEANYFLDKFKKEKHLQEKLYELHASITFTRAIFHIFNSELKPLKRNSENKQLPKFINQKMEEFDKRLWFKDLNSLRNTTLKETPIIPLVQPYIEFKDNNLGSKKLKIVYHLQPNNKLKVKITDFDTGEVIKLKQDLVDYTLYYEVNGQKIEIISAIEYCLNDWGNLLLELEKY